MASKLRCQTDTPQMGGTVKAAFQAQQPHSKRLQVDFEHGQWYVTCLLCGAQWSANDSNDPTGFSFDRVTEGDDYCDRPDEDD